MQKWKQSQEKINTVELLAPAGSFETFCGVIQAGADAVYAGGSKFGARAYANNFSQEELIRAIELSHVLGKRFYLTLNTLIKQQEIPEMIEYIRPLYEAGLDAVIIQDIGAARILKQCCPQLELHASTQMTISSSHGAKLLEDNGYEQVVLSRELSLQEIRSVHEKTDVRLECFVHGSLCYSYSGQCLMSSLLGGRSGNRGRCAQTCRLGYDILDRNGKLIAKNTPILSLKDMNGASCVQDLVDAGVSSLKIEGRMKQLSYAAGVTAFYRRLLDGDQKEEIQDPSYLLKFGNRNGFTNGYLCGKVSDMVTKTSSSHVKSADEDLLKNIEEAYGKEPKRQVDLDFTLRLNEPAHLRIATEDQVCEVKGPAPETASSRPVSADQIRQKLAKLGNTPFSADRIDVYMDENLFYSMSIVNQMRRDAASALLEAYVPKRQMLTYKDAEILNDKMGQPHLSILVKNNNQLEAVANDPLVSQVILESASFLPSPDLIDLVSYLHQKGKEVQYALPVIFRQQSDAQFCSFAKIIQDCGFDSVLVRSYDEIGFLQSLQLTDCKWVADANLYSWNRQSMAVLHDWGMTCTLPLELNSRELRKIADPSMTMVLYGRYPLMTSAQCVLKNCGACDKNGRGLIYLTDRYRKTFPVETHCITCENKIYNSVETVLFSQGERIRQLTNRYRIELLDESQKEIQNILRRYRAFLQGAEVKNEGEFTYGHFKRGVE